MNDQQHSSSDALTDEQIFAIADELPDFFVKQYELDVLSFARRLLATTDERASALYDSAYCAGLKAGFSLGDAGDNDGLSKALESRRGYVEVLRNPRAASTVEQPAAAPIDTPTDREFALSAAICVHPKGVYGDEGGSMCCPITHTRDASFAPSPADERAAFEKVFPMPAYCQRIGSGPTAGYAPTEYGAWEAHDFIRRWEGWKARAAASPAAAIPKRGDDEDA